MAWATTEEDDDESRRLITPLIIPQQRTVNNVADNDSSTTSTTSTSTKPITAIPENNSFHPIPNEIPSPTGGILPFQTTEHLRHRHSTAAANAFSTPTKQTQRQQQHDVVHNLRTLSLDDADAAAGMIRASGITDSIGIGGSEPRRRGSFHQHLMGEEARRSVRSLGSLTPPDRATTIGNTSTSANSSTTPTLSRAYSNETDNTRNIINNHATNNSAISLLQDHSNQFFSNVNALIPAPGMQRMERSMGIIRGSETDCLLLSSSTSVQSIQSEGSHMSDEDAIQQRRRNNNNTSNSGFRTTKMPPRCESFPPLMVGGGGRDGGGGVGTIPPFGLPVIEGSPSVQKRACFGSPSSPIIDHGILQQQQQQQQNHLHSQNKANNIIIDPKNKFIVLGWDMSSYTRRSQFLISAGGTFFFSLLYGYLQELISVELCHRKLGLFLAAAQFFGYTVLSYFFRNLDKGSGSCSSGEKSNVDNGFSGSGSNNGMTKLRRLQNPWKLRGGGIAGQNLVEASSSSNKIHVPLELYIGLSILRAIDLGMTNLAMQYVNYPAKTLMKSTRVVFTMLFGVIVTKKRYGMADFAIVGLMVAGLGMFMHADANASAVFQPSGIVMLTVSLLCDGAISNMSESIMNKYEVGQDEFIFRLYSVALFFVCLAAAAKGDLRDGLSYLTTPGTLKEMEEGLEPTWSASGKIITMILFSTTGFLGSSCSAAITKTFGALTMSITSTARKATTIFLSFALFPNECTLEHIGGIVLFIGSLIAKSFRASRHGRHHHNAHQHYHHSHHTHQHHHNNHHHQHNETNGINTHSGLPNSPGLEMGHGGIAAAGNPLFMRRKTFGDDAV